MKKVYRLLRNNIEKGPFSIDELLQHSLQPYDFIWVEGISKEWTLASHVDELNHSGLSTQQASPARANSLVFIQHPHSFTRPSPDRSGQNFTDNENFERRAEELKRDISMYTPSYSHPPVHGYLGSGGGAGIEAFDEIDFAFHKPEKNKYSSQFLMASLVFFLFIFGWYKGSILNRDARNNDLAAKPLIIPPSAKLPEKASLPDNAVALAPITAVDSEAAQPKQILKQKAARKKPSPNAGKTKVVVASQQPISQTSISPIETSVVEEPIQTPVDLNEPPPATVERKKTFGQAIKGLFKKKNKKIDTTMGK